MWCDELGEFSVCNFEAADMGDGAVKLPTVAAFILDATLAVGTSVLDRSRCLSEPGKPTSQST